MNVLLQARSGNKQINNRRKKIEGLTIWIADFRCLSCFAQAIMPLKSVELHLYISIAEIFSKRQRPPWLLGRSNFLRNKSHIVGRSFPSINTSSLSFLQLLHCSWHQSHPIRCLVTVTLLKTDSHLPLPLNSTSQMRLCRQKHDVRSREPPPDLSAVSALPRRQGLSDVPFRQIFVACYSIRKSRRWQTGEKCQINTNKREKNNAQMQITAGWLEMK